LNTQKQLSGSVSKKIMGKLLVIDGWNIVRRLYEMNTEPDSPEKAESSIRHSLSSFRKLLATHEPTHVLPAFHSGGHTWRHDLFPSYREHLASMPTPLREQIPHFYQMLSALNLKAISIPGVDAYDIIATGVLRWLNEGRGEAIIVSTDKRLHVLIEHGALIWDGFKSEWHDSKWVEDKFGVPPAMLTDLFALMGDTTNGVPGVSKVGIKTAAKLLQSYKTLEGVMAGAGILKNTLGEILRIERDHAFLSRELARLKSDVRLGITWKMLTYSPTQ
jgi:5'-3' exonuclease